MREWKRERERESTFDDSCLMFSRAEFAQNKNKLSLSRSLQILLFPPQKLFQFSVFSFFLFPRKKLSKFSFSLKVCIMIAGKFSVTIFNDIARYQNNFELYFKNIMKIGAILSVVCKTGINTLFKYFNFIYLF